MRRNTQRLYESIMKVVDKSVRKALNESKNFNRQKFIETTENVYDKWLETSNELVNNLMKSGVLYKGMDFIDAAGEIEKDLQAKLDKAVGGDWWEIGESAGLTYDEVESLWADYMQAKVDCICGIEDEDDDMSTNNYNSVNNTDNYSLYGEDALDELIDKFKLTLTQQDINDAKNIYKKYLNSISKSVVPKKYQIDILPNIEFAINDPNGSIYDLAIYEMIYNEDYIFRAFAKALKIASVKPKLLRMDICVNHDIINQSDSSINMDELDDFCENFDEEVKKKYKKSNISSENGDICYVFVQKCKTIQECLDYIFKLLNDYINLLNKEWDEKRFAYKRKRRVN